MAIETGHFPNRPFEDQNGNQFQNGGSFSETNAVIAGDGAIETAIPNKQGVVSLTKGSAAAITIANPVAVDDDGKIIVIVSETAFAHVITQGTLGFNGKGASGTCTFGAAKGNNATLVARNGQWWVIGSTGNTVA